MTVNGGMKKLCIVLILEKKSICAFFTEHIRGYQRGVQENQYYCEMDNKEAENKR